MVTDPSVPDGDRLPAPPLAVVLDLRGLQAYLATDDEDIVLVLQDVDGTGVSLEPGIGGSRQDAIDAAEHIGQVIHEYAELLRTMAARRVQRWPTGK